jgi:hypothetical protein
MDMSRRDTAKMRLLRLFVARFASRFKMPDGVLLPPGDLPRWLFSTPEYGGLAADKRLFELGRYDGILFDHYYYKSPGGKRSNTTIWRFMSTADYIRAQAYIKQLEAA